MDIPPLYLETKVTKKIILESYELNNDILYNLKKKLQNLEKKCYRFGFLEQVLNIYEYTDGIIQPEDLMCKVVYNVTFSCKICDPQVNMVIITKIRKIDDTLISSHIGPIEVITQPNKLAKNIKINENTLVHTDENNNDVILTKGSYVKVLVLNKKYNEGDNIIKVLGSIIGISSETELHSVYS